MIIFKAVPVRSFPQFSVLFGFFFYGKVFAGVRKKKEKKKKSVFEFRLLEFWCLLLGIVGRPPPRPPPPFFWPKVILVVGDLGGGSRRLAQLPQGRFDAFRTPPWWLSGSLCRLFSLCAASLGLSSFKPAKMNMANLNLDEIQMLAMAAANAAAAAQQHQVKYP